MGQKRESSLIEIDSARRFILQKDLSVHGHVLVWPGWVHYPKDFRKRYEHNPDSLRAVLADYVTETVTRFRGQQVNWDVINEPYKNSDFAGILGESVMVDWFKLAHQADPEAHLFINEPCVLKSTGDAEPWRKSYERMIKLLLDGGAPVYGIGEQSHITLANYQAPEIAFQSLNRFAKLGLPIRISELDIEAPDPESPEQQLWMSDALRDALIVYFSHPQIEDITFWGFWQGMHWKPNAALWDKQWNLRPHGKAFLDLVYKDWWTDQAEVTSQTGEINIRGFMGDYEITAVNEKSSQTQKVKLTKDGLEILIKL